MAAFFSQMVKTFKSENIMKAIKFNEIFTGGFSKNLIGFLFFFEITYDKQKIRTAVER